MYLVSLVYDYFFKKVFRHKEIAKKFFEDFLNVSIELLEPMDLTHKLTDKAMQIKFDYRCKINGEFYILEMQRFYPKDSIKRFYTYNCINNVVQLEQILAQKKADEEATKQKTGSFKRVKDEYKYILPTKTFVWFVNETLGFKDDFVTYKMLADDHLDFINDTALWATSNLEKITEKRNLLLKLNQNDTKGLSFLKQNELTFLFQRNIVKNKKQQKYVRWFEFARKTMNKGNQKEDFEVFQKESAFQKIIELLKKEDMKDIEYNFAAEVEREVEERDDLIAEYEIEMQKKDSVIQEISQKQRLGTKLSIDKMLKANLKVEAISDFMNLSIEEVQKYIIEIKKEEL